ncbi:MAG: hypothetical protein ACI915_001780 [Gammaproteobacteria bacterium]|jgi:uncharacterized protein involved in exopolysaccharide biosynthesis
MDQYRNENQRLEIYRIWRILTAYKFIILVITLVSTVVALATTYVLPEVYEASALVLVRPLEELSLSQSRASGKQILDFPVSQASPIDAPGKTYIEVIKSRAVAEKIVEALQLHVQKPAEDEGWFGNLKENFKTWVKDTIRATRHYFKYGRLISVGAFELAVEDIQEKLSLETLKNTYAFKISYRSGNPNEAAAVSNNAAEIFLEHSGQAYRNESKRMRLFLERRMDESRAQLESARSALQNYKRENKTFSLDSEYAESLTVISGMESTLELTETKLAGLTSTFSDSNPKVRSVKAERDRLQRGLSARYSSLGKHPGKEKVINDLKLEVVTAEARYTLIERNFEEARIKEHGQVNEIRIVSQAVPPQYPIKPLKYLYSGIGFLLAFVTAIGAALFVEYLDPRIRTVNDITVELELAVLGAIPTMKPKTVRSRWTNF